MRKKRSFVFSGKDIFAIQLNVGSSQVVTWEHYDASRATYRATNAQGTGTDSSEMDPLGADAGLLKPLTWPQPTSAGKIEPYYGVPDLNSATQGCVLDRVPIPCDILNNLMEAGGIQLAKLRPEKQRTPTGRIVHPLTVVTADIIPRGLGLFTVDPSELLGRYTEGRENPDRILFAHPQNSFVDANADCSIKVKFAGNLSDGTPEYSVGPDKKKLGSYISEGKIGTHAFRFEVSGHVYGRIGFIGGPDREADVKGDLANGGEWTVGQRVVSASVYSRWSDGSTSAPIKPPGDDSPLSHARNISANTFAWRDSPGSYNTALINDSRLVVTRSSIVFRVYATNGEKTCGITFRIDQSLRNGLFSGTIRRL